jgi:hypothetical protein
LKKIILFVLTFTLLFLSISAVQASQVESSQVEAGQTIMWTFNLANGDKFSGSLSISGGSGDDINFKVTDPQGTVIVGLGRVSQGRSFEFTAQQAGAYTFNLDNSFSIFSSKMVSLSYDVTPAPTPTPTPFFNLGGGDNGGISLVTAGVIAAVIVVVLIIVVAVVFSRKKAHSHSGQPLPPPPP